LGCRPRWQRATARPFFFPPVACSLRPRSSCRCTACARGLRLSCPLTAVRCFSAPASTVRASAEHPGFGARVRTELLPHYHEHLFLPPNEPHKQPTPAAADDDARRPHPLPSTFPSPAPARPGTPGRQASPRPRSKLSVAGALTLPTPPAPSRAQFIYPPASPSRPRPAPAQPTPACAARERNALPAALARWFSSLPQNLLPP